MKAEKAAANEKVTDPVCGMEIDPQYARARIDHDGETYHFCSKICFETFSRDPGKYVGRTDDPSSRKSEVQQEAQVSNRDIAEGTRHDHSTPNGKGERVDLPITGMTCAACANRIERSLGKQAGVKKASVNFATGRATVTYDPDETSTGTLVGVVRDVGYDTAKTAMLEFVVDDSERPAG